MDAMRFRWAAALMNSGSGSDGIVYVAQLRTAAMAGKGRGAGRF
jgi:hypothetical protein